MKKICTFYQPLFVPRGLTPNPEKIPVIICRRSLEWNFENENIWVSIKFIHQGPIDNMWSLVQLIISFPMETLGHNDITHVCMKTIYLGSCTSWAIKESDQLLWTKCFLEYAQGFGVFRLLYSYFLSALLQLHLHSRLNTWLQWIGKRQLLDETRII